MKIILFLFGFLFIIFLSFFLHRYNDSFQIVEKEHNTKKNLSLLYQLQEEDKKILSTYGWRDKAKKIVHIPIDRAMILIVSSLTK